MALFKRKVQETVTDAVDIVKDIAAKATSEKMDVWGDVAKIGTFAIMAFGAVKAINGNRGGRRVDAPDVRTMTINNYYYGGHPQQFGRKKRNV